MKSISNDLIHKIWKVVLVGFLVVFLIIELDELMVFEFIKAPIQIFLAFGFLNWFVFKINWKKKEKK